MNEEVGDDDGPSLFANGRLNGTALRAALMVTARIPLVVKTIDDNYQQQRRPIRTLVPLFHLFLFPVKKSGTDGDSENALEKNP